MERLSRVAIPLLLGMAVYYAFFGGEYSWWEVRDARAREVVASEQLELLRLEIDSLQAWADALENDPAVLERLARERFGLVGEGEVLYRVVAPEEPEEPSEEEEGGTR